MDPLKAKKNLRKHRIAFDRAAEIFLDPLAISIPDEEHSELEERWVTLGRDQHGILLVVIHTFLELSAVECKIGIISARKGNHREIKNYEEAHP